VPRPKISFPLGHKGPLSEKNSQVSIIYYTMSAPPLPGEMTHLYCLGHQPHFFLSLSFSVFYSAGLYFNIFWRHWEPVHHTKVLVVVAKLVLCSC